MPDFDIKSKLVILNQYSKRFKKVIIIGRKLGRNARDSFRIKTKLLKKRAVFFCALNIKVRNLSITSGKKLKGSFGTRKNKGCLASLLRRCK